jgi:hypothetical protein
MDGIDCNEPPTSEFVFRPELAVRDSTVPASR